MVVLSSEDDFDEEPGEVIESAPPQKVGEERQLRGLKKKLLRHGHGWETPNFNDVVTVHRVGTLLDGAALGSSTWDTDQPLTFTLGNDDVPGLDRGITSMKKGEVALFTLPADDEGDVWRDSDSVVQFEVELLSWIRVVDVCKDGGVIKKIVEQGSGNDRPSDLDEVLVKYQVALVDGTVVEETPEGGVEFYVKDGHLFPILPKVIMTMTRGEKAELIVQPQYAFGETGRDSGTGLCRIPPNSVLHANIELVSFKPVINVTGDSKVLKKILKEGEGAFTANEDAHVTVSFTAMLEDGTVFEKRRTGEEQPLEFITDEAQDLRTARPSPWVPQPAPIMVVPPTSKDKGKRKSSKEKSSTSQKRSKRSSPEGPLLTGPLDPNVRVAKRVSNNLSSEENAFFKWMTSEEAADMAFELNVRAGICMAFSAGTPKETAYAEELQAAQQDLEVVLKANEDLNRQLDEAKKACATYEEGKKMAASSLTEARTTY
ncbi:peptidyl-prolyl cis-trans isomerase FKBP62 isoform X5 [Vigna angularis]|uniref:peptidyl-prolyl cis-trans isomerase FKBP62 isoform X5 n=1 Tax=Phaseolus angularis TaxID=3914 RepID=UPI00080A0B16|nr:peptidyl-prolyl cis-trans isomerase FKBP62 isoform X5 [Vigna angularis]